MSTAHETALAVENLSVGYVTGEGTVKRVVEDVSFALHRGRVLGLAGESGCGKSTAALAALGYEKPGTRVLGGRSLLNGDIDLLSLPTSARRDVWGRHVAYVPQSAAMSLNPGTTVGRQLAQTLRRHLGLRGSELRERQLQVLTEVGLPDPAAVLRRYPFEFSGGQQQRISLAIALSCRPSLLVLDEPTTGLDVTTQARITALLRRLVQDTGVSALYISHDLALLGQVSDDIAVMYAGEIVESSSRERFAARPAHPYAQALFDVTVGTEEARLVPGIPGRPPGSVVLDGCAFASRCAHVQEGCRTTHPTPVRLGVDHDVRCLRALSLPVSVQTGRARPVPAPPVATTPLVSVEDLTFSYRGASRPALQGVDLRVMPGERVGVIGESGSGKSTLLRAIAGLVEPSTGTVRFAGEPMAPAVARRSAAERRAVQYVFQNPDSSLNPRQRVGEIVTRPVRLFRDDVPRAAEASFVEELLEAVGLPAAHVDRYPGELSGGQRQRVAIARAFAAGPQVLLCDEVTSALDVSVQATVLDLLVDLSERTGVGIVFVGHDLGVVRTIADRALVMRGGHVLEQGPTEELFGGPQHPYTRELVAAPPLLSSGGVRS